MTQQYYELQIEGPGSEAAADALADLLEKEFGERPVRMEAKPVQDASDPGRVDPIAAVALALSIPSAVLAAVDAVQRSEKKKKADLIIEWAVKQGKQNPDLNIRVTPPEGVSMLLH